MIELISKYEVFERRWKKRIYWLIEVIIKREEREIWKRRGQKLVTVKLAWLIEFEDSVLSISEIDLVATTSSLVTLLPSYIQKKEVI